MLIGILRRALFVGRGENHVTLVVVVIFGMHEKLSKDSKQKNSTNCNTESHPIAAKCIGILSTSGYLFFNNKSAPSIAGSGEKAALPGIRM